MYTRTTKNLSEDKKKEFAIQVIASQPVLKRFKEIVEEDLKFSENNSLDKENYKNAAWPYMQADSVGQQRAYRKIIKLIDNLYNEEK